MSLRPASTRRGVAHTLAGAVVLGLTAVACAAAHPPRVISDATPQGGPGRAVPGYRALFRGQWEGREGRERFKLAVSIAPPDRLRLEVLGPVGGPRLALVANGRSVVVLRPADRTFERSGATAEALERWLGVPLGPSEFAALLQGEPMCESGVARGEVRTRPAATFGRTVSWYEVTCPPGDIRYEARCAERGGTLLGATVREGISGAIILEVEYGDYEKGLGPRWPRQIHVRLLRRAANVTLAAVEGPWSGEIPEEALSPEIPEGFEERPAGPPSETPGLLSSDGPRTD